MYECPNCAGNLKFDIARQKMYCGYCGTEADPYDLRRAADVVAPGEDGAYEATVFICPQCGGEIISEDTTAATFCSFCGSSTILDSRISRERRPAYIIPFTKTQADCRRAFEKMMRRALFVPGELKKGELVERFRGIYIPYWIYSFEKKGTASFSGKKTRRRGDYRITDHYRLECEIEEEYRGLAYDASAFFSDSLSAAIAPFDLGKGSPFTPAFLSGFYADTNDVNRDVYQGEAERLVVEDGCRFLAGDRVCKKYHAGEAGCRYTLQNAVRPTRSNAELAMLPVWFLSYRSGDRVGYAVVNGQTGKAAAELPVEPWKYLAGSLGLALPLFLGLNRFFTITPTKILVVAAILALLCIGIANGQIARILARDSGEDDRGLASRQPVKYDGNVIKRRRIYRSRGGLMGKIGLLLLLCYGAMILPHVALNLALRSGGAGTLTALSICVIGVLAFWLMKRGRAPSGKKRSGHLKEKLPTLAKPFAGAALAAVILVWNPVSDRFYYIGAFVCMGTVFWAFMDIIKHHNMLTTRRLPQFNRRGGDEIDTGSALSRD